VTLRFIQNRSGSLSSGDTTCLPMLGLLVSNSYKVVLCIGRRDDEGQDSIFPSLLHRAQKHGIPSIRPENINSPETLGVVEDARAMSFLAYTTTRYSGRMVRSLRGQNLAL